MKRIKLDTITFFQLTNSKGLIAIVLTVLFDNKSTEFIEIISRDEIESLVTSGLDFKPLTYKSGSTEYFMATYCCANNVLYVIVFNKDLLELGDYV